MEAMEAVKKAAAALVAKREELANVNAEIRRAQTVIDAARHDDGEIARLKQQRDAEVGHAFIDKRDADVANIDKAIAKAEKGITEARAAAAAATSAIKILNAEAIQLEREIPPLQKAEDEAINELSKERMRQAVEMVDAARAQLKLAMAHIHAADIIRVRNPRETFAVHHWEWKINNEGFRLGDLDMTPFKKLQAELESCGVRNVGVARPQPAPEPTKWVEPRPTLTYADGTVVSLSEASAR